MAKPLIVLADSDEQYLIPLQLILLKKLYTSIDLEVITDRSYFEDYFSKPRSIDILVIGESMYDDEQINKHNVTRVFLLCEQEHMVQSSDLRINRLYRYMGDQDILNQIMHFAPQKIMDESKDLQESKIIAVYSAMGGSGKTTVGMGMSACLTRNYKKVLFVGAQYLQTFHYQLSKRTSLPGTADRSLYDNVQSPYSHIKPHVLNDQFDYIPPFRASISSLNLPFTIYYHLLQEARESKEYDYIVVDLDSTLTNEVADILELADKAIILVRQDEQSVFKTETLLQSVDYSNTNKYLFVCNCFDPGEENVLYNPKRRMPFGVSAYVNRIHGVNAMNVHQMSENEHFQKLVHLL